MKLISTAKTLIKQRGLDKYWRQSQSWWLGAQHIKGWLDEDFYLQQVGSLPPGISAASHYLRHGWLEQRQPHPLFDPVHYRSACIAQGLGELQGAPLLHFCRYGLRNGILCSPLIEPSAWKSYLNSRPANQRLKAPPLGEIHPLGNWALYCSQNSQTIAAATLKTWIEQGIPPADLAQIKESNLQPPATAPGRIPNDHKLRLLDGSSKDWNIHAWLQHLPVEQLTQLNTIDDPQDCTYHSPKTTYLLFSAPTTNSNLEIELLMRCWHQIQPSQQCIVSNPLLSILLQGMGVGQIKRISSEHPTNEWLDQPQKLKSHPEHLGLPPIAGLAAKLPIVLGDAGHEWQTSLTDRVLTLPSWEQLLIHDSRDAQVQAHWLKRVSESQRTIVLLNSSRPESNRSALKALNPKSESLVVEGQFTEQSLLSELTWFSEGCPFITLENTPVPDQHVIWQYQRTPSETSLVSVCISLHNYEHTIERALNSILQQSLNLSAIDLVVVDDASTDSGRKCVEQWMQHYGLQFGTCRLIGHNKNGGLAAARNTAFAVSHADWCFVLDADNLLHPSALERSLKLAMHCSDKTAVVHPWIAVEAETANKQLLRKGLHGLAIWQRERFLHGNHIDAMALIRRAAWADIGGYTHIPGGWEDFDFWCCLIEAGWLGVCLPQVICSYVVHQESMLSTTTNNNLRWLCRLMQQRHPWLQLDPSEVSAEGGVHQA